MHIYIHITIKCSVNVINVNNQMLPMDWPKDSWSKGFETPAYCGNNENYFFAVCAITSEISTNLSSVKTNDLNDHLN